MSFNILLRGQEAEVDIPKHRASRISLEGPSPKTLETNFSSGKPIPDPGGSNQLPLTTQPLFTWNEASWEMKTESELPGSLQPAGNKED